ncbi:hypothetical protein L5515_005079 [Caenorhabditis briggsae]|uniref:F-box domain-containing protein n=1 Tax=Caenorhabditis briggsae TaxID=6238 RepID=A0AAE9ERP6_CAEBR|nr:hypothetical protein L5515_005079 [Caenorhabditis briggsae]
MTSRRFPFRRLPDDLCLKVLRTMEHREIIASSLTSKKLLSLVQSLDLSLNNASIKMKLLSEISFDFGRITVGFKWRMGKNGEEMTSLNDIPVNTNVSIHKNSPSLNRLTMEFRLTSGHIEFKWSNQRMTLGEWIHHLCSIFRCERYDAEFHIGKIRVDIQSLRNTFPKLRETVIYGSLEPNDQDIQSVILRAFLPDVKYLQLHGVPLQGNLSIQHIGIANLEELKLCAYRNLKLDDLLTLNVECCTIVESQFSLRDLNRFFKLWRKGSNAKLKYLRAHVESIADWNVLMKGLQPEEARRLQAAGGEKEKEYTIQNCYGIRARIKMSNIHLVVTVILTVSN